MPASIGPGTMLLTALLSLDCAFAHAAQLRPQEAIRQLERRSRGETIGRIAVRNGAVLEKRFINSAATADDLKSFEAVMDHGWHGFPTAKSVSEAPTKPFSSKKTQEKGESEGKEADKPKDKDAEELKGKDADKPKGKDADKPKGKDADKPEGPITAQMIRQMANTRWQRDSNDRKANYRLTISRLYQDLPKRGKIGSGTGGTDRLTFEYMTEEHRKIGREPQNAWRFLERGAKAKAGFGPVHFKAWEAAFNLIKSDTPQFLSSANIKRCMEQAMRDHEGIFGKNFKAGSYH